MASSSLLRGLALLLALFAIVGSARISNNLVVPAPFSQQAQLEQIRNSIQQQGSINAASVGSKLALQVDLAFHSGNVSVGYINATLTDTSLVVVAKARVWDATVLGSFTFFFATPTSTDVQLQIQFNAAFDLASVYRAVFPGQASAPPSFLGGVKSTEQLSVVLSTFAYNSYPAGLTVSSTAILLSPSSNVLAHALATLDVGVATATFCTELFVPLYSPNPTYIDLKLTEQGSFALTSSIQCSAYQLSVSVSSATSFALSTNLAISVKNQAQPITFAASAQWKANTTASFTGSLTGAWNQPFGVEWFSISSASLAFAVSSPASADKLAVTGNAVFSFAPQTQSPFAVTILGSGDFVVSVSNLPLGSISSFYSAVTKSATPDIVKGLALSGNVGFALASSSAGSVPQGLSLSADVTLGFGTTLDKAAKTLAANPQKFVLSLFVPVYSSNVDNVKFSLVATGGFGLTRSVSISAYRIAVAISTQTTVGLSATAQVALAHQQQPLTFNIAANWQENTLTTFQGALQGSWQHPFGLSWLKFVSSVSLSISVGSSQPGSAQVSITGTGDLASNPSSPFTFAIVVRESGDWQFSVNSFPLGSVSSFYGSVAGSSAPAVLGEVGINGQASLALSTYSSGGVAQGLTVNARVTASGSLSRAAATLGAASSQTYTLTLFVPLFGAQGGSTISLSESGAISLARHVQINSFSVNVALSSSPSVTLAADVAVTIPEQAQPIDIKINAQWNEQSTTTSFTGQLSSWSHPLGLDWLSFQNLNVNLVVSSGQVTQLSFSGNAALKFASSPVTASVSFDNQGNVVVTVSNIPIGTLGTLYQDVVGSAAPHFVHELNAVHGTVSFTVATANVGGARKGLALTAQVQLTAGSLSKAVRTLIASPDSLTFNLNLFVPIFDADRTAISLSLTESGSFQLTRSIHFQQFQLSLAVGSGQQTSIALGAQLAITLAQQPQPLVFSVSGKWVDGISVSFTGRLVGQWNNPFGAHWLAINSASVAVTVQQTVVQSLAFGGGAVVTFDSTSVDTTFSITTDNDFVDTTFAAQVDAKWSIAQVARSVAGHAPAIVSGVNENTASLMLVLSTYAHGTTKTGLTIKTKGAITGDLLSRVHALQSRQMGHLEFAVDLNIPLFTANPLDLSVTLELDSEIAITKDFFYEKLVLEVDALPLAVSVDTEFKATFAKNPPLLFNVIGDFSTSGIVTLTGDMIGTWENVYGFKGFDVSDVVLEVGFNPVMCAVDGACLSDLGLGFNLTMGTKTVAFDGNIAVPDFEDVFARGSIKGADGMAFTMRDVVIEWNRMFPAWRIPTSDVPANWGLRDTSFYFAPKDGTFGGVTYQEGFAFSGGITLLDMDLDFTVDCSEHYADFCDFSIHVNLDFDLFYKMLKREVDILNEDLAITGGELIFFHLGDLSLTQWSAKQYSAGVLPRWQIELTVFDRKHHLDFQVEQWELASSFKDFFRKWIKHVF